MQHGSFSAGNFTFAVGGIYGRLDVLEAILAEISARCETGSVVFLGNYGLTEPDASGVLERLRDGPPAGWRWICIRGSQEQELLELASLADAAAPPDRIVSQRHRDWLASLPALHADAHRIYVHAALDEAFGLMEQPRETTFYGLYRDGDPGGYRDRHVVHAYAPSAQTPHRTSVEQFGFGTNGTAVAMFDDARPGGPTDVFTLNPDGRQQSRAGAAAQAAPGRQALRASLRNALAFEEEQLEHLRDAIGNSSLDDVQRAFWPDRVLSHQRAILEYRWRLASLDAIWP